MTELRALKITTDNDATIISITTDTALQDLYKEINCEYVQGISLDDELFMYIDEEGAYKHNVNISATLIASDKLSRMGRMLMGAIHGTAVIVASNEDGDIKDLQDAHIQQLLTYIDII